MSARCDCCGGTSWFQCRCDETCEAGQRRIAEGRDATDVEGDPEPTPAPGGSTNGSSDGRGA